MKHLETGHISFTLQHGAGVNTLFQVKIEAICYVFYLYLGVL